MKFLNLVIDMSKRKHITLSIEEKCKVLDKLKQGISVTNIAREFGIGKATVVDIRKNQDKIRSFMITSDSSSGKRKTLKAGEHHQMVNALFTWFLQQRRRHAPISAGILCEKARYFYKKITNKDDFQASDGWFQKFKARFGIRLLAISGKKNSADSSAEEPFKRTLEQKISEMNLQPEQIYNADESSLFWQVLPEKNIRVKRRKFGSREKN